MFRFRAFPKKGTKKNFSFMKETQAIELMWQLFLTLWTHSVSEKGECKICYQQAQCKVLSSGAVAAQKASALLL